mgnify:CR=1 FL=1|jgi:hypothetical protein
MAKIADNVNTEPYTCTAKKSRLLYLLISVYQYGLALSLI